MINAFDQYFQGDSGGPLFVTDSTGQFVQTAVLLRGDDPCGNKIDKPDIFANVGLFTNLIVAVVK